MLALASDAGAKADAPDDRWLRHLAPCRSLDARLVLQLAALRAFAKYDPDTATLLEPPLSVPVLEQAIETGGGESRDVFRNDLAQTYRQRGRRAI